MTVQDEPAHDGVEKSLRRVPAGLVLALALLTGLIYFFPTLVYWTRNPVAYFSVTAPDEDYYAAVASSTAAGKWFSANPFLADQEHAHGVGPETLAFLPRFASAFLIRLFGLGISFSVIGFLAPFVIFLLAYTLLNSITRNSLWGLAGAFGLLLLPYYLAPLVYTAKTITSLFVSSPHLKMDLPQVAYHLAYSRRYNPALSAVAFYAFLWLHWRAASTGRRIPALAAGLVGGLLFYCYFYFAVGACSIAGLWALTCFLGARERLRAAALVVFIQVLVGIPFLILVFQNMTRYKTAFAQEIHTPFLQWPHILATVLAVALVFLTKESSVVKFWLTAVGVAPVIAMNQQVLTGLSVEPWHFTPFLVGPLSSFILCAGAAGFLPEKLRVSRIAALGFIVVAISFGGTAQLTVASSWVLKGNNVAQLDSVFRTIRSSTSPSDVLLLGPDVTSPSWAVAATQRPVFAANYMGSFPSNDPMEYRRRGLCYYWLLGYDLKRFETGPASDTLSLVYTPEGFTYLFYPRLLSQQVKNARVAEFRTCLEDPRICCRPEYRVSWLVESNAVPFDRTRLMQLFWVGAATPVGGCKIARLERRSP